MGMKSCVKAWGKAAGSDIAEAIFRVPRRSLLREWGFGCESEKVPDSSDGIDVHLFFPLSLIEEKEGVAIQDVTEYDVHRVTLNDLNLLPAEVPLTIFFHGGAFILGDAYTGWTSLIRLLYEEKEHKPLIVASVDYSLAPDYPFPTPVEESLTVVSYLLDQCPGRKIHLSGLSAGGSLAIVAAMECHRKYPGRIISALIGTAYLDPKADSLSYYLNSNSSHLPTVGFLRWGWQAYLGLPPSKDKELERITSKEEALGVGSNRTSWSECKWNTETTRRLITPHADLPEGLDSSSAPTILLTTNQADPLLNECLDLLAMLKERSAKVTHFDHIGTHWLGTELDKTLLREVVDAWAMVLFQ